MFPMTPDDMHSRCYSKYNDVGREGRRVKINIYYISVEEQIFCLILDVGIYMSGSLYGLLFVIIKFSFSFCLEHLLLFVLFVLQNSIIFLCDGTILSRMTLVFYFHLYVPSMFYCLYLWQCS